MDDILSKLFYDPAKGYCSAKALHDMARKVDPTITTKQVEGWLSAQPTYTRHRYARRRYTRNKVLVTTPHEQWQADLADLTALAKYNQGYKYILTIIDVFSKYGWAVALKNKAATSITDAFKSIFEHKKPQKLQTDAGTEFLNKNFQDLLKQNEIKFFSTNSEVKASVVERFNRTLKEKMWRYFTKNNTYTYIDILPDLIKNYNHSKHRTIGMAPAEVNSSNQAIILNKVFRVSKKPIIYNFEISDKVRINKSKRIFEKGYTANWSEEIFTVVDRKARQPPVYVLQDKLGEVLEGVFYETEILKIDQIDEVYVIEKIIRQRVKNGKKEYFVKWRGYDDQFNSWVSDLIKL